MGVEWTHRLEIKIAGEFLLTILTWKVGFTIRYFFWTLRAIVTEDGT